MTESPLRATFSLEVGDIVVSAVFSPEAGDVFVSVVFLLESGLNYEGCVLTIDDWRSFSFWLWQFRSRSF